MESACVASEVVSTLIHKPILGEGDVVSDELARPTRPPTAAEIEDMFTSIIVGKRTREFVSDWAARQLLAADGAVDYPPAQGPMIDDALSDLALVDAWQTDEQGRPTEYMYPQGQVAEWLDEFRASWERQFPRPLTERELSILHMLLSKDGEGIAELRLQVPHAAVVGRCKCGCPTIDIDVDREAAVPSRITRRPAIDCFSHEREAIDEVFDLMVWVEDGYLAGIELVYYDEGKPTVFPEPASFDEPA